MDHLPALRLHAVRDAPARMAVRRFLFELERRRAAGRWAAPAQRRVGRLTVELPTGELMDRSVYLNGVLEYLSMNAFVAAVRRGGTILDIGANVGWYTLLAAQARAAGQAILAFEPNPQARARLTRNLAINGLEAVDVMPVALGSEAARATLHVPSEGYGYGSLQPTAVPTSDIEVEVLTVDEVRAREAIGPIRTIKLDVEGWEPSVLEGARATLDEDRPVIFLEVNRHDLVESRGQVRSASMSWLLDHGYALHGVRRVRPSGWRLQELRPTDDPRAFREPWQEVNLVALAPGTEPPMPLSGNLTVPSCGLFNMSMSGRLAREDD